jgi:ligand-binding sensor domain-containing protein
VLSLTVGAQTPSIQKIRLNLTEGKESFNTAIQDRSGYIWLGSDQGLHRFDGLSLKNFRPEHDTIPMKVLSIHESPSGTLWIGCKDGSIYRLEKDLLAAFNPEEGNPGAGISDIVTDTAGVTWWSTLGEGIYFYLNGRVYNINYEDGLMEDYVYDLQVDEKGRVWAGTDGGVAICSQADAVKKVEIPSWNSDLYDPVVRVLKADNAGNIYLGFYESMPGYVSGEGGYFLDLSPDPDWPYDPVSDLVIFRDAILASTISGNLVEIGSSGSTEIRTLKTTGDTGGPVGKIYKLLEDREGNVWILSSTGLYRTSGSKWRFYEHFAGRDLQNIHAIHFDSGQKLWFSNDNGVFRIDFATGALREYLQTDAFENMKVTCLAEDLHGYIWAGTFNYGVFRINPRSDSWIRITEDEGLVNNNVLSISPHHDTLWLATLGGATEIVLAGTPEGDFRSIRSFDKDNGLVSNYIYSVYEDRDNRVWFATDGDGISVLERGQFRSYGKEHGLEDDVVYSIRGDDDGNIWIATSQAGVYHFDGQRFTRFGTEEGLSSLQVTGLSTSGAEVIVILENGIDIIHRPTGRVVHYSETAGLAGISTDLNVVSTDPGGNIWIGTKKGIIRYQPGITASSAGPQTILEQMSVFLEAVEMEENMVLGRNRNHISFTYNGIWMSNPEEVRFQVMLEGYDLGWKTTVDRAAIYSSLPAGKYTFRVRASLDQSFRNSSEAAFSFRIRQPFWASPWFILVSFIFFAIVIYFIIHAREKRLKRKEQEKKEKVEFEFQMLKNQVNPHFLFNSFSTLMALIEDKPDVALQYTEKLSDFFRIILQIKDEEVILVREELEIIGDYFFLLKHRFGENLSLETDLDDGVKQSFIPPMTLQILVENAVKHNVISRDKPLRIRIYSKSSELIIENNLQPKKSPELSTGIGLENVFKRYRLKSDREPVIEKTDQQFRVRLPILREGTPKLKQ